MPYGASGMHVSPPLVAGMSTANGGSAAPEWEDRRMDDQFDVSLEDDELLDEVELTASLMVAANRPTDICRRTRSTRCWDWISSSPVSARGLDGPTPAREQLHQPGPSAEPAEPQAPRMPRTCGALVRPGASRDRRETARVVVPHSRRPSMSAF